MALLRGMSECAICGDECVDMVRCGNGHGCCTGCDAYKAGRACPLCREPQVQIVDVVLPMVMRKCAMRLGCEQCDTCVPSDERERHRAWCPAHTFACPVPGCMRAARASAMATHLRLQHGSDSVHTVGRDGRITLIVSRAVEDVVLLVADTTGGRDAATAVLLSFVRRGADVLLGQMSMNTRAYYKNRQAAAWQLSVRQVRVQDCNAGAWTEEYRVGVISPAIASRENVMIPTYSPIISPRCCLLDDARWSRACTAIDSRSCGNAELLRSMGLRDLPLVTKPYADSAPPGTPVAILQFHFVCNSSIAIGDVYPD